MTKGAQDAASLAELADRVSFREIDAIIESLSTGNLSSFLNNEKLNEALENDAYIINNVFSRAGITRSCEHGLKISSIIKHKALKLNETTALELLDNVMRVYLEKFGREPGDFNPGSSQGSPQPCLDFCQLSEYFPSGVLAYSSLSWDNLPLSGLIANESASQQRQKRSLTSSANPASYKELDTLVEYEQHLETKEKVERIRDLLAKSSAKGPVNFWEFVLDRDPANGFNNTCFNLYSLTFLATKGEIAVFRGPDSQVMIQARDKSSGSSVNFQSIVTGWSYKTWAELVGKLGRKNKK